jgi:hypothetical protein
MDWLCNVVQRIPRNASSTGLERPRRERADPDDPESAVVKLQLVSD